MNLMQAITAALLRANASKLPMPLDPVVQHTNAQANARRKAKRAIGHRQYRMQRKAARRLAFAG